MQGRVASARPSTDFDGTADLFDSKALGDDVGMSHAASVLAKLVRSRAKKPLDPRWNERAARVLGTPFPKNHTHEGARSELLLQAARLLIKSRDARVVPVLFEVLTTGDPRRDPRHLILIELIGKLGSAADCQALCTWFEGRPAREISQGSAWSIYALVADALVRLADKKVFAMLQKALTGSAKGKSALSDHHRWSYEKALEVLMAKGKPNVGMSVLPEP
jgi:hypothetical protein